MEGEEGALGKIEVLHRQRLEERQKRRPLRWCFQKPQGLMRMEGYQGGSGNRHHSQQYYLQTFPPRLVDPGAPSGPAG